MKMKPPQLVSALGDLDPTSFVYVFLSATNRLRKKDRVTVLELLCKHQLEIVKNSKSLDEILDEAYESILEEKDSSDN